MKRLILASLALTIISLFSKESTAQDSLVLGQDAIYNRPFISLGQTRTAIGGYLEGNSNYFSEDGVSDGLSFEMRRFNIFLYSQIDPKIRFLSELEFEHGTREIALETALVDFELNPALNFRAGIILPALGLFNTNHDSPNWGIIDRPISSTGLIPTTLSEVGFGFHGKLYPNEKVVFSYDAYLVNGLQEGIVINSEGRTHLGSGKTERLFEEDNNGSPMVNGRLSLAHRKVGELGIAYYGGIYNEFRMDGVMVDKKRNLSVLALDFSSNFGSLGIQGEAVWVMVDAPEDLEEIYGEEQFGGFADFTYPLAQRKILGFEKARINSILRLEYADFNTGNFTTNIEAPIGDEHTGIAFGLGFRPKPGTVIRANYRYEWLADNLGNPSAHRAGFQFGFASYF